LNGIYPRKVSYEKSSFKGGQLKFYVGTPSIEESDRDDVSVRVSIPWEIV
jgi:hypothetical protein